MPSTDFRNVNGLLIKPGDKVVARRAGDWDDRQCTVIKTRDDPERSLFIQPDVDGAKPYWALDTKIQYRVS